MIKKSLVLIILFLLIITSTAPNINITIARSNNANNNSINDSMLDLQFIYNITENLSYIIFTEYNESAGEIAKGRAFGTKGEHKAAEILLENMSKIGLWAYPERIGDAWPSWRPINLLATKIEVLDYELRIKNDTINKTLDCGPHYAIFGPRNRPLKSTHNFSYKGLKVKLEHPPLLNDKEDYILLMTEETEENELKPIFNHFKRSKILEIMGIPGGFIRRTVNYCIHPHWKGSIIIASKNKHVHNMWRHLFNSVPKFSINKTNGDLLNSSRNNFTVDFYLNQSLNRSVVSYNIIGQLNGTDRSKTVLVCCLYDSWWCQGTGDSAIGMAIVMAIAKYFMENNIIPKYNMKFIGFAGEEYGMRGSKYYENIHRDENIINVIDLNQLGFTQEHPRLTLEVAANNLSFLDEIWEIVERTDYINRTHNVTDILPVYKPQGHLSDDSSFATKRPDSSCKTLCFIKNGPWLMHHKDGWNHTIGDVIDYFNWTDVSVTSEIILNVTKYLTVK